MSTAFSNIVSLFVARSKAHVLDILDSTTPIIVFSLVQFYLHPCPFLLRRLLVQISSLASLVYLPTDYPAMEMLVLCVKLGSRLK
jgi:hypothetical protein